MGKVLGGGSSINVMYWARGHMNDWNYFADAAGDAAWNYESVLNIYRRIEDWHGEPDPKYRGRGGPLVALRGLTAVSVVHAHMGNALIRRRRGRTSTSTNASRPNPPAAAFYAKNQSEHTASDRTTPPSRVKAAKFAPAETRPK
jgi:choline dehydrogenase-like flavoprotein